MQKRIHSQDAVSSFKEERPRRVDKMLPQEEQEEEEELLHLEALLPEGDLNPVLPSSFMKKAQKPSSRIIIIC